MNVKEQIYKMNIGEIKDIVFSNGILKSTKQLEKINNVEFLIHDFTDGWATASLNIEQAILYVKGKLKRKDLNWF